MLCSDQGQTLAFFSAVDPLRIAILIIAKPFSALLCLKRRSKGSKFSVLYKNGAHLYSFKDHT